eukprot:m.479074 g.479074  ORF g.479074 m.479074 type:complete len:350 (-) comp21312_c0_seq1:134-1183(-)
MKVALRISTGRRGQLCNHARLFKQVRLDVAAGDVAGLVKVDADELAKAGRVVVFDRLGVTKRFQNGVGCQQLFVKRGVGDGQANARAAAQLGSRRATGTGHVRKKLNDFLGVLCLTSTRFTRAQNGLRRAVFAHVLECLLGNGKDVRRQRLPLLPAVQLDDILAEDGVPLVRVDRHAKQPRVRVLQVGIVAVLEVVQHGGFVEVGEVGHVLGHAKLGRVLLQHVIVRKRLNLAGVGSLDENLVPLFAFDTAHDEAIVLVGNPDALDVPVRLGQRQVGLVQVRLILFGLAASITTPRHLVRREHRLSTPQRGLPKVPLLRERGRATDNQHTHRTCMCVCVCASFEVRASN